MLMTVATPLRRNVQFQMLWAGSALSQLGAEILRLVMPLLVLGLTASAGWAGVVAGAVVLGSIVALVPAGVCVDRFDRRRLLVWSQACRLGVAGAFVVVLLAGRPSIWLLALLGALEGLCAAVVDVVRFASIRAIVPVGRLRGAYTQEESRAHAARLIGPPLGGLLFGVSAAAPFVVNLLLLATALVVSWIARIPARPRVEAVATHLRPEVESEGGTSGRQRRWRSVAEVGYAVRWIWTNRGLRGLYLVLTVVNLLGGAFLIPLLILVGERGGDGVGAGSVLAGAGIGGLVGALCANRLGRLLPVGWMILTIVAFFGVSLAAMALPLGPWWPMLPLLLATLVTPSINVVMDAVSAELVPESMLGRVDATLTLVARGMAPFGPVLGGLLAGAFGAELGLTLLGGLLVLTAVVAALNHDLCTFTC